MVIVHTITTDINTDETDYDPLNPETLDVILFFENATRRDCFNVEIINDVLVEGEEQFSLVLMEDPFSPPPINTVFFPNVTDITITDRDGKSQEMSTTSSNPMTLWYLLPNTQRL